MSEQRDTKFAGFAKLLWDELLNVRERGYIDVSDGWLDQESNDEYRQIIAKRVYDLAVHIVEELSPYDLSYEVLKRTKAEIIAHLPDFDVWPEDGEK